MSYALNASTEHVVRQQDNKAQYSLALIAALQKTYNNKKIRYDSYHHHHYNRFTALLPGLPG